jgi:hypothetical protein
MAWVLFLNLINTVLIFMIYKKFFIPFVDRVNEDEHL